MRIITGMNQDTPEWLEFRLKHLGSSDSTIIMELSPWMTPLELWQQRMGLREPQKMNPAMQRGKVLESIALASINRILDSDMKPMVAESDQYKYMSSSFDGFDIKKGIACEIKCPGKEDHQIAIEGNVPEKYYPQLMKQIYVGELDYIYYFSYDGINNALLKIERDDKYIRNLIEQEAIFWECILKKIPPESCDRDCVEREDEIIQLKINKWVTVHDSIKNLESLEKEYREEIIKEVNGKNTKAFGLKITKVNQKGRVDYSQIDFLNDVDLEKYRKPPTESWRLTKE